MTDSVRWGILATGAIAELFVSDLRLLPDARVVAVGSRTRAAARAFADRHGIPRAHGSWRELAEDPDVDVIYLAAPHSAHHAAARLCLEAGKPVLVEKPLTLDHPTASELVNLARASGVFLMEAMWTRCFPAIHRIQALIGEGAIGEITAVHADFGLAGPFDPSHRLRNRGLGGGALLDLGVYPVTIAHLALGKPETITARARLSPEGIDENTAMIFGYPSGALAVLSCSIIGDSPRRAAITGTGGRIELPRGFLHPSGFTLVRGDRAPEHVTAPAEGYGFYHEAAEVHRCLRAGLTESPLVPLDASLAVMSILDEVRAQIGVTYPA
jgi:predicted dehydrogenase